MRIPRLYIPQEITGGATITAAGKTAQHVAQVLRLQIGSPVRVFNGSGCEWNAVLLAARRAEIDLEIGSAVATIAEPSLSITLAQGVARNDRMDLILQKSVELGVARIQPLWLAHCQNRVTGERLEKRLGHWRGIIASACEQCGRGTLPELCLPASYPDWIARQGTGAVGLMLQPDGMHVLSDLAPRGNEITILVGPEGGMNTVEIQQAAAVGFTGIRLGQRILRTETAALSALAGLQALWGDFSSNANTAGSEAYLQDHATD